MNNNVSDEQIFEKLLSLHRKVLCHKDIALQDLQHACYPEVKSSSYIKVTVTLLLGALAVVLLATNFTAQESALARVAWESRCALQNNFLVMEATRPETDCRMCEGVKGPIELFAAHTIRKDFAKFAYASRPVLVRGATANWTAMSVFGFNFFRSLYETIPGGYDAVEEECQFFPFNTEFTSLKEVFAMSSERAHFESGQPSWYIGWSNCEPRIANELRRHYQRPHFLPEQADASAIDWIFMGGPGPGASLHLDYVSRRSWQAQVSGSKTWRLVPPPECEHLCTSFSLTVNTGDIVLIDTNQWYHDTRVNPGPVSITIGSEYG